MCMSSTLCCDVRGRCRCLFSLGPAAGHNPTVAPLATQPGALVIVGLRLSQRRGSFFRHTLSTYLAQCFEVLLAWRQHSTLAQQKPLSMISV
jgi:hypothetical protein